MTGKAIGILLTIIVITLFSCGLRKQKETDSNKQASTAEVDSLHADSIVLKETFREEDTAYNEYLAGTLQPIRDNFKRINSIATWTSTVKKDLDESTEGGEATYFYSGGVLEKIITRHFGETFQQLTEYYLLNGQLSFVFEKAYTYNRPIYYDSASMKENNDNQAFDFKKSEIKETRNYFGNGKLIHQLHKQDHSSTPSGEYLLQEQKRIKTDFDKLKLLMTAK